LLSRLPPGRGGMRPELAVRLARGEPVDPGAEARVARERVDVARGRQQRGLGGFFGVIRRTGDARGQAIGVLAVALDELDGGVRVASTQRGHETGIGIGLHTQRSKHPHPPNIPETPRPARREIPRAEAVCIVDEIYDSLRKSPGGRPGSRPRAATAGATPYRRNSRYSDRCRAAWREARPTRRASPSARRARPPRSGVAASRP